MFDVDFKLKNETDFTIKVFTMIEGEYAPAVMILKPNEEMLHFKPSIGEISISVMAKRSSEIEQLRKDYALAWENHLLHEQIFVLTEAKIERLREALTWIERHPVEESKQWEVAVKEMKRLARSALPQKETE